MPSGRDNMTGAQKYVGYTCAADTQAKREIAAVAAAGMTREPSYASQPGYVGKK